MKTHQAIVIIYEGTPVSEDAAIRIARLLNNMKIADENNLSISVLDQKDLALTLVKAKEEGSIIFKKTVEKSPEEQALIYLSEYFGKEIWRNPVLFGIHLAKDAGHLSSECKKAIAILCKNEVDPALTFKYGYTAQHITVLKSIARIL